MSNTQTNVLIIGGGIVGLSTALALSRKHPSISVRVLEKESLVAAHQTGRNSGVIHSGLYYKPGSLKAKMSVEGAQEMKDFCAENGVPHRITGKVVVAVSEDELPRLEELYQRGQANGVPGIEKIGPERLKEIEPHATGLQALWVPRTGIVDYQIVAEKMVALIQKNGGTLQASTRFLSARRDNNEWVVETTQGEHRADFLINCGGLYCDHIARACGAKPHQKIIPFRGEYYQLAPEAGALVKTLIYPVPNPAFPFLGVHFTNRMRGGVEAGPNAVLAFKREGYSKLSIHLLELLETLTYPGFWKMSLKYMDEGLKEMFRSAFKPAFVKALQRLVPEIQSRDLKPGGAGVRAQALDRDGRLLDDFLFLETEGALHVLNAPSPAATASLPIGRAIAEKVRWSPK